MIAKGNGLALAGTETGGLVLMEEWEDEDGS